jgi:nucleotide-binding universal stress UspA family protein
MNTMFKSILVPVDINHEASWTRALPLAVKMARETGAALHVTSVVPDFGAAMVQDYFPADYEAKALQRAEIELERIVAEIVPADLSCKIHLEHGSIRKHILDQVKSSGADLIIMAAHPPEQLREFLVGSHADWIVRHAPVSVFVVRSAAT